MAELGSKAIATTAFNITTNSPHQESQKLIATNQEFQ